MNFVKLQRVSSDALLPTKGTLGSAYYDLYTVDPYDLRPHGTCIISTGWKIEVPKGYFLDIRTRSGMAGRGICVTNSPGTVDEDFRGELKVILTNLNDRQVYWIKIGDRIAQCALMPVICSTFEEVKELSITSRGTRGYGSTGR